MILDNIKELIKDIESILIKDDRFKEDVYFKKMIKTIYTSDKNNNNPIISYDITPIVLSNLSKLGKNNETYKCKDKEHKIYNSDNNNIVLSLKELKEKIKKVKSDTDKLRTDPIDPKLLEEIEIAEKSHDYKKALELANKILE